MRPAPQPTSPAGWSRARSSSAHRASPTAGRAARAGLFRLGLPSWCVLRASANLPTGVGGLYAGYLGNGSIFWCARAAKGSQKYPTNHFFNLGPSTLSGQCQYLAPVAPRPESSRRSVPILLGCGGTRKGTLDMNRRHSMHKIVNARRPVVGENVVRDAATHNQGKVHLGEGAAPAFAPRAIRSGEKVVRDA